MGILNKLTEDSIRLMFPNADERLNPHLPYIIPAMERFSINTEDRVTMFLAQLAHESGEYYYMEEIASGQAYEGWTSLGNTQPGDGVKFKGHGPIQITGRANHRDCGKALGLDLERDPLLITKPEYGTLAAAWFWDSHSLSLIADKNWICVCTKIINGGYTHLLERISYWNRNRQILGLPVVDSKFERDMVKIFQGDNGLVADGDFGPKTMAKLKELAQ